MDAIERQVEEMMSRRTYRSDVVREKTRMALIDTLRTAAAIESFEDDEAFDCAPEEHRNEDSDGVACTTIAEMEERQQEKKRRLKSYAREMFSPEDFQDEATAIALEESDINRKIKWGYTLLHFAALEGNEVECDRLLAAGADKYATDNSGKMPYQKAKIKGFEALSEKLKP